MIAYLRGILAAVDPPHLVIEVQGIAYEVEAPLGVFADLPVPGQALTLYTHLVIRDDAHLLYGFRKETDRRLFRLLLKITGVGPKLALALLSGLSETELRDAVARKDAQMLSRVPGVGRKTAERLLVELAGLAEAAPALSPGSVTPVGDAVAALVALGYRGIEASQVVREVASEGASDTETLVRQALKRMVR